MAWLYQISSKNTLKANHNNIFFVNFRHRVVSNIVKEHFESKSQPRSLRIDTRHSCIKYRQRTLWKQITTILVLFQYQFRCIKYRQRTLWKQITTDTWESIEWLLLYQISSKNTLKANHNTTGCFNISSPVVSNIVKEHFESKSQPVIKCYQIYYRCIKYRQRTLCSEGVPLGKAKLMKYLNNGYE